MPGTTRRSQPPLGGAAGGLVTAGARPWFVLTAAVAAQASTSFFQFGVPYLIPVMLQDYGLSLGTAALLVAAPSAGMMLTLLLWGYAADRVGDRGVMASGLACSGFALSLGSLATRAEGLALALFAAGACGAAVNVTSGRLIMSNFGIERRGLAMGIRQTAPLIGMGLAAVTLPAVSVAAGLGGAMIVAAGFTWLAAVVVVVVVRRQEPHRNGSSSRPAGSPYRESRLWRIHAASALLVVPQIGVYSFAFVFLVGPAAWTNLSAGIAVAASMTAGAAMRLAAGAWSDRLGNRLAPMRKLAVASAAFVLATAAAAMAGWSLAPWLVLFSGAVTASWNGLAFTAVAETAGGEWAGRALGAQNTVQYLTTAATPPLMAVAISMTSWSASFALISAPAFAAACLVPGTVRTQAR